MIQPCTDFSIFNVLFLLEFIIKLIMIMLDFKKECYNTFF